MTASVWCPGRLEGSTSSTASGLGLRGAERGGGTLQFQVSGAYHGPAGYRVVLLEDDEGVRFPQCLTCPGASCLAFRLARSGRLLAYRPFPLFLTRVPLGVAVLALGQGFGDRLTECVRLDTRAGPTVLECCGSHLLPLPARLHGPVHVQAEALEAWSRDWVGRRARSRGGDVGASGCKQNHEPPSGPKVAGARFPGSVSMALSGVYAQDSTVRLRVLRDSAGMCLGLRLWSHEADYWQRGLAGSFPGSAACELLLETVERAGCSPGCLKIRRLEGDLYFPRFWRRAQAGGWIAGPATFWPWHVPQAETRWRCLPLWRFGKAARRTRCGMFLSRARRPSSLASAGQSLLTGARRARADGGRGGEGGSAGGPGPRARVRGPPPGTRLGEAGAEETIRGEASAIRFRPQPKGRTTENTGSLESFFERSCCDAVAA